MKINLFLILIGLFFVTACSISGVEHAVDEDIDIEGEADSTTKVEAASDSVFIQSQMGQTLDDSLVLTNGIRISYFQRGTGEALKKGDVIKIDYRVKLEDGTIFDGNHLVKKAAIPFLVGWNQQTPGWDLALEHLRVGDDVDVFIPSQYARGEKGIKGLVPPHANNILSIRIHEKMEPIREGDGIKIWKYDELKTPGDSIGFEDEVFLNYWASSESHPRYDNNYQRGETFKLRMGDGNIVPGLYKALYFGREGDRLMIKIPPEEAYGAKGLPGLVEPNEEVFYDIQIAKVNKKSK